MERKQQIMKKINKHIVLALAALMVSVSCTDLDTYPESKYVTEDQKGETVELDPSKAEAGVNAIFTQFSTYMTVIKETARHNDFGYPAVMLMLDSNGYDMIAKDDGYNWFSAELTYENRINTSYGCRIIWGTMYNQIYAANNVIASIDPETTDPEAQFYLAQALATRAFDYWVLAQLFQFNYVGNESKPCVPLITEENSASVGVDGAPRSTVAETYELILGDINKAVELMESTTKKPQDKRYISTAVAYGLRARINLTMQKWPEAADDAQKAINNSGAPYSIDDVKRPTFNNSTASSWMWGILIAETDRVVTSGIVNFPSHMGSLNYGYNTYFNGRQINKKLYSSIPSTDARKGWWLNENKYSPNLTEEEMAYVAKNEFPGYTHMKYAPYNNVLANSTNASDIPLMRVEEMYLIRAEGLAMSGNSSEAKTLLESFIQTYRDPEYTCRASSSTDIQEEVYHQRRIELWGEGLSWFDIMRLNKNVDRRGAGYPNAPTIFNITAGSPILLYRIPEKEVEANAQISQADNNEAAPLPAPVPDVE